MKVQHKLIIGFATICYLLLVYKFWFICDDAFISFRYSKNLADGFGLTYNVNGQLPVEGYSNFLLVMIGAGIEYLGLKIDFWIPLFSTLCGLGLLRATYLLLTELGFSKNLAACGYLLLAVFPPFFIWSSSGMEAVAMSFFLFQIFRYLIVREEAYLAAFYAILLSLIRAEGICWAIIILVLSLPKFNWKRTLQYSCPLLLVLGSYFLWRYNYFQELVPNTVTNKVGSDFSTLERGLKYAINYFTTFVFPVLIFLGIIPLFKLISWRIALPFVVLTLGLVCYPIVVGGDFMTMFRFYTPLFPFQVILLIALISFVRHSCANFLRPILMTCLVILSLLPAANQHLVSEKFRSKLHIRFNTPVFRSEYEQWKFMKMNSERWRELGLGLKSISQNGNSLVAGAIGYVGYFSELTIFDRFGLVEPRVAKRTVRNLKRQSPGHDKAVSAEFFLDDQPTFLKAYLLIGERNDRIAEETAILKRRKIDSNYQVVYHPLERKLHGKKLGLLVLQRIKNV